MKNKLFTLLVCFVFAATACKNNNEHNKTKDSTSTEDTTATADNEEDAPQMSEEEINKIYMEYMTPGDNHKMLASMSGEWDVQTISYMMGKPDTSMGTTIEKSILNGLYTEYNYTGTMMGMPYMGRGIMGYDNAKKVFVSTWVDNFGSGMMKSEGTYDEATKSLTMIGKFVDPATKKDVTWKQITTIVDENTYTNEFYSDQTGEEMKAMVQTATRKVGA